MPERTTSVHGNPFDPDDGAAYRRWRAWKLAHHPARADELVVDVDDARWLRPAERDALLQRIAAAGVAIYRTRRGADDRRLPALLGAQIGLHRLDRNWLAGDDGVSDIAVAEAGDGAPRGDFIPYTDRPIGWHTDGYYHPPERRIHAMVLHCVRPAAQGGDTALLDHEMAWLALRDSAVAHVRALMRPDAMTIPERRDEAGVARAAQSGPVFSLDQAGGLHMRYTARSRSIEWKADDATRAAVTCLETLLAGGAPWILRLRLEAGMGLVGRNVLHRRSGFVDDPAHPRLLYRARFLDCIPCQEPRWRNG